MINKKINIKDKHGWIRIVEAMVAILLIAGFLTLIIENYPNGERDLTDKIYLTENIILREIELNSTYRNYVLSVDSSVDFENFNSNLKNQIINRTPEYLECEGKICDFEYDSACNINSVKEEIYARSILIAANSTKYEPKILKIFCWTL